MITCPAWEGTEMSNSMSSSSRAVRPATEDDSDFIFDAFDVALGPFYGGDHRAHARRVLKTHLNGGQDNRGLLSMRQVLYVLWADDHRAGVLNLVFKRQKTCKISPLILYPNDQKEHGLGSLLIDTARQVADDEGCRQLYCTVAERNAQALTFFREHGFIVCGRSANQYKPGETEILMRDAANLSTIKEPQDEFLSVSAVNDDAGWTDALSLLISASVSVEGIDPIWVENMKFSATESDWLDPPERRRTWTFIARDAAGACRAVAVVNSKKGGALKVMPIAATDTQAFRALLVDMPTLLAGEGLKAYVHLSPSIGQLVALQDCDWAFDAHLPHAYGKGIVTEQWSYQLCEENRMRNLRIHGRYLTQIAAGEKTLEIRVGYDHIKRIRPGEALKLMAQTRAISCRVAAVRNYASFAEMLATEDLSKALPGVSNEHALSQLQSIYPPAKEKLGVVVLELSDCQPI